MSLVKELVDKNFAVAFTMRHCVQCVKAKEILSRYFTDVGVHTLDEMNDGEAIEAELRKTVGVAASSAIPSCSPQVPAIFIHGEYIGGLSELEALEKSGVLRMRISQWKATAPQCFPQSPIHRMRSFPPRA